MIRHHSGCRLTASDHNLCEDLLTRLQAANSPLYPALKAKLASALVLAAGEADPLAATINSRLEFQIDDAQPQSRILVASRFRNGLVGLTLPIDTPYGMALLGMRQHDSATVTVDGENRRLILRRIAFQPQVSRLRSVVGAAVQPDARPASVIDLARMRRELSSGSRRAAR